MTKVILCILFFSSTFINSIKAQDIFYYYKANGQRIIDSSMSAKSFAIKYFDSSERFYIWNATSEDMRMYVDQGVFEICFKSLTSIPYGLITLKKLSPESIKTILNKFTQNRYFNSNRFYDDLEFLIKNKRLTTSYLLETLGIPNRRIDVTDLEDEKWVYDKFKLEIFFKDTLAIKFKSSNYSGNIKRRINLIDHIQYFEIPSDKFYTLAKVINKGKVHYTLELYSQSEIYTENSPLRIIMKNGREIVRDDEANSPGANSTFKTYGRFYLTSQEATLLATSLVTDFKLGDAHEVLPTENAERLLGYFKALLVAK